ncbi:hypothetical protein Pelo_19856 [Pelomyxa schiedti]|nr:hypothetical protein Pelo_19856 [Pelomyxa schiedti]
MPLSPALIPFSRQLPALPKNGTLGNSLSDQSLSPTLIPFSQQGKSLPNLLQDRQSVPDPTPLNLNLYSVGPPNQHLILPDYCENASVTSTNINLASSTVTQTGQMRY